VRWVDLGRWALRLLLSGLILIVFAVNLDAGAVTDFIAAGDWRAEAWLGLLPNALGLTVALWLLVRVNQKLKAPKRRAPSTFRISGSLRFLIGLGLTGLAYFLGYRLEIPSDLQNTSLVLALGFLQGAGLVGVYAIPILTFFWLLMGPPEEERGGLYRGRFADREALHPLMLGPREAVPGDALLVGMVNEGTPARPRMALLARRPGFGGQQELGHALFVYPSRKGKGLHLATQGIYWRNSMLFIDPKGEFFGSLSAYRRALGQYVFVLDPSNPERSNQYDPFADLGDSAEALRSAAKLILEPPPNSREPPYFAQRATNGLVAALRAAKLAHRPPLAYLYEVKRRGLAHFIRTLSRVEDDVVQDTLTDFIGRHPSEASAERLAADERLQTIWSTLNTRTADLLQPGVRAVTSGCDFRARDLVLNEKPVTLFLTFRESEIEATKAFLRLTTLALITDLIRIGDTRAHDIKHKLLLGFDEAGRIPVPRLFDLVSTVSSRGMSALIYVQDLAQLEATYGRANATTIRGNCDTQVFYRPNDPLTARYVTERAGKTSVKWLNTSTSVNSYGTTESASWTWRDRDLITPSEFMQLPEGQTLAFVGNLPPLLAHRVDYRWLPAKVAEVNRLNEGPLRITRPAQQAVTYAPASPPEAKADGKKAPPTSRPGTDKKPGKEQRTTAPAGGHETDSSPDRPSPPTEPSPTQEHEPKKKRVRTRKRKGSETPPSAKQEARTDQGRDPSEGCAAQARPTFPSGLEAAVAALWERGGDLAKLKPAGSAMTSGGMAVELYTDGQEEVAVCRLQTTGRYFIATLEELGLEAKGRRAQA